MAEYEFDSCQIVVSGAWCDFSRGHSRFKTFLVVNVIIFFNLPDYVYVIRLQTIDCNANKINSFMLTLKNKSVNCEATLLVMQ